MDNVGKRHNRLCRERGSIKRINVPPPHNSVSAEKRHKDAFYFGKGLQQARAFRLSRSVFHWWKTERISLTASSPSPIKKGIDKRRHGTGVYRAGAACNNERKVPASQTLFSSKGHAAKIEHIQDRGIGKFILKAEPDDIKGMQRFA